MNLFKTKKSLPTTIIIDTIQFLRINGILELIKETITTN